VTSQTLQIVQFVHPGFEYDGPEYVGTRATRSGIMGWKPGKSRHDRKFMLTRGSLFDSNAGQECTSVPIVFWGEWEGPSVFWRVQSPGRPFPTIVHAPFRPVSWPTNSVLNTDPMVFGDAFIHSNCLQAQYSSPRALSSGSIVLFGRHARAGGRPSFGLDTCLVIDRLETRAPVPFDIDRRGTDLLTDAVLHPLHAEGATGNLNVYFGRQRGRADSPFSFFPARLAPDAPPPLFARPELRPIGALQGVISPENMQGIKLTPHVSAADRDAIWTEVVHQVTQQGCELGYYASPPPVLTSEAAAAAAVNAPTPLGT